MLPKTNSTTVEAITKATQPSKIRRHPVVQQYIDSKRAENFFAENNSTKPKDIENISPRSKSTDIESLRISTSHGKEFAVKKQLINIPIGRPSKSKFIRIRDGEDYEFSAYILEIKEVSEIYLITEEIADFVNESARPVRLHLATDRRGNPMIVPVPLPGEDGRRNPWHESLAQAIERAKRKWVRIVANLSAGAYDLLEAQGELSDPIWPEQNMLQLVEIAFRGKIIDDVNHPVIRELLGQI